MQKTLNIRKFTLEDLPRVMQINRLCLPENYGDYFFINLHRKFPETFIVAEENGELGGYILCRIELKLVKFGFSGLIKKGHIVSLAVLPQFRRHSIGEALVKRAMVGMRLYDAKQCFLEVRESNLPAVKLYKKLGFDIIRSIHGYYSDGEAAFLMNQEL